MSWRQTRCETRNSRDSSRVCCIAQPFFRLLRLCSASRWAKWPTLYCSAATAQNQTECWRPDISFVSRFWSRHCARRCSRECNQQERLKIEPLEQSIEVRFVYDQHWTRGGKLLAFVECLK